MTKPYTEKSLLKAICVGNIDLSKPFRLDDTNVTRAVCHHVVWTNDNGIKCAYCSMVVETVKIKHPRLAWLWANWRCIKQKVKHAIRN